MIHFILKLHQCPILFWFFRYLSKTFYNAVRYTQPNVIVFLGDLMDEGHISDIETFQKYKLRFDSIFETPDHIMVNIIL